MWLRYDEVRDVKSNSGIIKMAEVVTHTDRAVVGRRRYPSSSERDDVTVLIFEVTALGPTQKMGIFFWFFFPGQSEGRPSRYLQSGVHGCFHLLCIPTEMFRKRTD